MVNQVAVRAFFFIGAVVGTLLIVMPELFRHIAVPPVQVFQGSGECQRTCPTCPNAGSTSGPNGTLQASNTNPRMIDITMEGRTFAIALASTDEAYVQQRAMEFCVENHKVIGLSARDVRSLCQAPLTQALLQIIHDDYYLPIHFDDSIQPDISRADVPFPDAHTNVVRAGDIIYLHIVANDALDRIIRFRVGESTSVVADTFCRSHAAELSLKNKAQLANCVGPVQSFIDANLNSIGLGNAPPQEASASSTADKSEEAVLPPTANGAAAGATTPSKRVTVGDLTIDFAGGEDSDAILELARGFCQAHWEAIQSQFADVPSCAASVASQVSSPSA